MFIWHNGNVVVRYIFVVVVVNVVFLLYQK